MAWYRFTGNSSLGHSIQGQYNADSELTLIGRLRSAGATAVSIKKMSFFASCLMKFRLLSGRLFPVRKRDLSLFYYQLADMLEIGIPLKNALLVIANHLNNPRMVQIIHDITTTLSKGASFAAALHKHERLFSAVTVRMISFAQSKEELAAILRYCDQSMRRMSFMRKILFVVMPQISITIVLFMILFFLRFHYLQDFYYAIFVFKNPVPISIHYFDIITKLLTIHLLRTVCIVFIFFLFLKMLVLISKKVRLIYHSFLCYFPVISGVVFAVERERLSLLYSVLLKGGANTQKCAQYSVAVINNLFFKRRVKSMSASVQQGEVFSNVLKHFRIFSPAEVQMIALGAVSNNLVKTFERIYGVSQIILERKLFTLIEFIRLALYVFNAALFFSVIIIAETLFFYPGAH